MPEAWRIDRSGGRCAWLECEHAAQVGDRQRAQGRRAGAKRNLGVRAACHAATTFIPLLVHDGIGIWLAARRLHEGRFVWPGGGCGAPQSLTREQLDALVLGLPWQRFGEAGVISLT